MGNARRVQQLPTPIKKGTDTLRVGSINICRAFYDKEDHIKQLISAQKLDMLFVQECDIKKCRSKKPTKDTGFPDDMPKENDKRNHKNTTPNQRRHQNDRKRRPNELRYFLNMD